ncbi:MAG: hypothetical protein JWN86_3432 [Planctomycetota bacterium]|nr:hypothetical protein [Planctomycetota bacterium]
MTFSRIRGPHLIVWLAVVLGPASLARAGFSVAVVHADTVPSSSALQAKLTALGLFSQVTLIDAGDTDGTPTLAQLSSYDVVLAYTNFAPDNAGALGDVLADYVDAGHGLVLATYGLGNIPSGGGTAIAGRIATTGYSPLVISATLGDLDGGLTAIVPADPIFNGVNLAAPDFYYHDSNFAHPDLDAGAVLLATDTSGVNLIARSANGRILGMDLFPGFFAATDNSDEYYKLLGNSLQNVAPVSVPEPASVLLTAQAGIAGFGLLMARRASARRADREAARR